MGHQLRLPSFLSPGGAAGLSLVAFLAVVSAVYGLSGSAAHRLPSGPTLEPPSREHLLGTDDLGIDLLAQLARGAWISLAVGLGAALLAGVGGSLAGMYAGYRGGRADALLMGLCDVMMVIPQLPLMIVFGAFFGPSLRNIILVIAAVSWTHPARTARAQTRHLREAASIRAARSYGAGFLHLAHRHFVPALFPLVAASAVRVVGRAITAEAGLSFLGLGDPLSKSWGVVLNRSISFSGIFFTDYWKWWIMAPLVSLVLLVVSVALLGRDLELVADAKLKRGRP